MWDLFLLALAMVLVIEGIFPFLNPSAYRRFLEQMTQMDDHTLRRIGLGMMVVGAITVYLLK